jgi:hypothetical protein
MEKTLFRQQKRDEPADSSDALRGPGRDGRRRGPTARHTMKRSTYTRAALSDAGRALPVLAVGALVAAVAARRKAS